MSAEEIRSLMLRAQPSRRSARNLLEDGDHDFAISCADYAMFHAATAALLARGIKRAKHSGVIAAFGEHFVKPGRVAAMHQRALLDGFEDRTEGDYAGVFPTRDNVERRIEEARQFVEAVEQVLRDEGIGAG